MNTGSVVIKKVHAFLSWLNFYFEYSLIFRGFTAVKNASRTSRIVNYFRDTDFRNYWEGSLLLRLFAFIVGGLLKAAHWCVSGLARLNKNSVNYRVFVAVRDGAVGDFVKKAFAGCAPVRLARWFVGSCGSLLKVSYMAFLGAALIIPYAMWSNMFLLASAVLFAGVYALKWCLTDKPRLDFSHISPALMLFVGFCVLSIFTGYGGGDSLRVFVILFACVVHAVLVSLVFTDKNDLRMFFTVLAVALAVAALFGFYQLVMGIEIRPDFTDLGVSPGLARLYSSMGNPNADAQAWAMLLPFLIAACVTVKCDIKRLILMGLVLVVLAAFALTYSRGGYVAFVAGMGIFILMSAPRLVPVALIALIIAIPFIPVGILERLLTIGQDTSSQYRFRIWEGVLRMLEDFWVRGIGMGPDAFIRIYRVYAHPAAERAMHSHNQFLDIIVHSGIGAFLAFLAFLFRLFKRGVAAHINSRDSEFKMYTAAAIAALTVFMVLGVGEYVWFYPRVMLVFWLVAGVCMALPRLEARK